MQQRLKLGYVKCQQIYLYSLLKKVMIQKIL